MDLLGTALAGRIRAGLCLVFLLCLVAGKAQTLKAPEHQVKAGFIYNFAKLTKWPVDSFRSADAHFVIGVFGDDPLTDYLNRAVKQRTIQGRHIKVVRVRRHEEALTCQVLFIAASERQNYIPLLNAIRNKPVLTVSEVDQFTREGGMIRMVKDGSGNLKFEVHRRAARRAGLKFSSQLLALAVIVPEKGYR